MNCYWLLKLMAIPRTNGVKVNIFFGLKATTVKNRGESPNFPPTFYFSSLLGAKKKTNEATRPIARLALIGNINVFRRDTATGRVLPNGVRNNWTSWGRAS